MPLLKESYGQILDGNGDPYPGAKIWTYDEGTTTPKSSFTTRALSVANANPVVSDGNGRFPAIWLSTGRYKIVAMTAADVTIYTADGIEGSDAQFSVLTTRGDLLTRSATTAVRLGIGTNGQILGSNGTDPVWTTGPSLTTVQTWTAAQTFQLTDDGAGVGPDLALSRISASPAANDALGRVVFYGRDSAGVATIYADLFAQISSPTDTTEEGVLLLRTISGGAIVNQALLLSSGSGIVVGAATGGLQGAGRVNATGYYKNGVEVLNSGVVAWVYTNSTGTIQSSYNVSSVVLNATGNYTINFTTPLVNANYAIAGSGQDVSAQAQTHVAYRAGDTHSTSALQVRVARHDAAVNSDFSLVVYAG